MPTYLPITVALTPKMIVLTLNETIGGVTHICVAECCFLLPLRVVRQCQNAKRRRKDSIERLRALDMMSSNSRILDPYFDLHSLQESNSNYDFLRFPNYFKVYLTFHWL